ncbi:MAG: transketolase family protein [Kiritimatiellia bacterium]
MREALAQALTDALAVNNDIYVLSADTGFHVFDSFRQRFPHRFLNVGICEAAMIGIASGLAHCGKQVFCYGIAPFVTLRCLEQIRVDICYANLPVRIIGVGGGLAYGPSGMTHHSIEDIAVMRALPNMTVICPGDPIEVRCAIRAVTSMPSPCYLRIGKSGEPVVHEAEPQFEIGKGIFLREGQDVAIVATGNMLHTASVACTLLATRNLSPALVSMHTVKPLDRSLLANLTQRCRLIVTVEEHNIVAGLGSAVAAVLAEENPKARLHRIGIPDTFAHEAGSQLYFRRKYGLTAEAIAETVLELYEQGRT